MHYGTTWAQLAKACMPMVRICVGITACCSVECAVFVTAEPHHCDICAVFEAPIIAVASTFWPVLYIPPGTLLQHRARASGVPRMRWEQAVSCAGCDENVASLAG